MTPTTGPQVGRNEKCPCGSGRKYKQCCLGKDEEKARKARAQEAEKAEKAAEKSGEKDKKDKKDKKEDATPATDGPVQPRGVKQGTHQPWKKSATNTHAFQRMTTPRKVGGG